MTEMLDRIAQAIDKRAQERGYRVHAAVVRHLAAAAVEALREPTEAMLASTVPFPEHLVRERDAPDYEKQMAAATLAERMGVRSDWQMMIDAILKV